MSERNEMKGLIDRIALDHIEPDPEQPRRRIDSDSPQWRGLVESIRRFGVLEPILLRPCPKEAGRYIIICGERRWRAAGEAGLGQIPAQVIHQELLIAQRFQVQLMENALREGLEPLVKWTPACVSWPRKG